MGPRSSEQHSEAVSMGEPFFLRRTTSGCSDWSDPEDQGHAKFPCSSFSRRFVHDPPNRCVTPFPPGLPGIIVPEFLQPLFGLDFVPYLPSPEGKPTTTHDDPPLNQRSGDGDDCDDDEDDPSLLQNHPSVEREIEVHLDDTEVELEEIDESNRIRHDISASSATSPEQPSARRKKFFRRNRGEDRVIKKAIGKTINAIKGGRLLKQKESTEDVEKTPKRGTRSVSREVLHSLAAADLTKSPHRRQNWAAVEQQVEDLKNLEDRARTVSQRANAIEERISSLTAEAAELQQALAKVLRAIDVEEGELETTERELTMLNHNFRDAARQLSASIERFHSGIPGLAAKPAREVDDYSSSPTASETVYCRRRSYTETRIAREHIQPQSMRAESFDVASPDYATPEPFLHRRRANTDPQPPSSLPSSTSFMRVSDLELESSSSLSSSLHALDYALQDRLLSTGSDDLFLLDENIPLILCRLADLGLQVSSDESSRFLPVAETSRLIKNKNCFVKDRLQDWPFSPWHVAKGKDILLWTGGVPHKGFGHDWPVVKARCVVRTSPRKLLDFLMDSEQLKRYNKMSQGREDVFVVQEGVDTTAEESVYGIPGDARIMRALNKPKLLPKTIEMLSLWYTKTVPGAPNAYMTVSRSVWENSTGTPKSSNRIRSEMLLGVNLIRPCPEGCEFTTITHVFAPGVPEMMAKRMAPASATNMMREIQNIFAQNHSHH